MAMMTGVAQILEHPALYRLWQAPFASQKIQPMLQRVHLTGRVLDVGCGPGTSSAYFEGLDYVGIDLEESYLEYARRRYRGAFQKRDISRAELSELGEFEIVLVNSVLHHIDDAGVDHALSQLARRLTARGRVHILELVLPSRPSISRIMARLDRGKFPRSAERWVTMFTRHYESISTHRYRIGFGLWDMIYFEGCRKS